MKEENRDDRLHLPSLSITGFRGIDALTVERLGRVTLLAGKNSVGKTTVLDAVQFYAANGRCSVLPELLESNRRDVASITYTTGQRKSWSSFGSTFPRQGRFPGGCPAR